MITKTLQELVNIIISKKPVDFIAISMTDNCEFYNQFVINEHELGEYEFKILKGWYNEIKGKTR